MKTTLLNKASEQALCEALGFDEGRAYYLMLIKEEEKLAEEFSYSKRYRILKSLFESGAVGKFKAEKQDLFKYTLLPPSFLYFKDSNLEIIEFLEKKYLENYSSLFDEKFSQIILKDEKVLILFLLKYFMKDSAKILANELKFNEILGKKSEKVTLVKNKPGNKDKRMGTIDKEFVFKFVNVPNMNAEEFIGYILNNKKCEKDITAIETEMNS